MATPAEIQALLRFLSKDAKLPLAVAMSKIKALQEADLTNPQRISQCKAEQLQPVFGDDKTAKQVLSAAKRLGKKRSAAGPADGGDGDAAGPKAKRGRFAPLGGQTPAELEESLGLPEFVVDEAELAGTVLLTNRAPVVLAFGVVLLKYTMPEQPLSSRLSLAQAVVSMNSRSKAVSLGLESGKSAEEEGWGTGKAVPKS